MLASKTFSLRSRAKLSMASRRNASFQKRMSDYSKRKFDDDAWEYTAHDNIPKTRTRLHFPMDDATLSKLSQETGVPAELIEDGNYHLLMMKARNLFEILDVPVEKEKEFVDSHILSPGFASLEWALPSPPPLHTFEELPLLKVVTEGGPVHH